MFASTGTSTCDDPPYIFRSVIASAKIALAPASTNAVTRSNRRQNRRQRARCPRHDDEVGSSFARRRLYPSVISLIGTLLGRWPHRFCATWFDAAARRSRAIALMVRSMRNAPPQPVSMSQQKRQTDAGDGASSSSTSSGRHARSGNRKEAFATPAPDRYSEILYHAFSEHAEYALIAPTTCSGLLRNGSRSRRPALA